ncbi:MAG TPA: AAA family ATPase [Candidatus Rubrimentiphilum sp.]|nr:AAA family ATPase [Candidatus Rubrimentiphilum sp.]
MDTEAAPTLINFSALEQKASAVFTPARPIAQDNLFAGRLIQVRKLVDAINQPGQHAVLFGERGVGKTSLANVLGEKWLGSGYIIAPRIGCLSNDDWSELWTKALSEINLTIKDPRMGFRNAPAESVVNAASQLPENFSLNDVRISLTTIGHQAVLVLIFDEFDQLNAKTRKAMAEAVKQFSDYNVPATLILVGVADSVGELLRDHQSVERALVQVQMPRMSDAELEQILNTGFTSLGMTGTPGAMKRIIYLSRGLPHYTHLLGLHSSRTALRRASLEVNEDDVKNAIGVALENSQQSHKDAYVAATSSSQKNHLYCQVLLACALADTNPETGYFTASAVRDPLSAIMKKRYDIPSFARHLNEFCSEKRKHILERIGDKRNYKFRFRNPLMQPFVVLKGYASGMISADVD